MVDAHQRRDVALVGLAQRCFRQVRTGYGTLAGGWREQRAQYFVDFGNQAIQ
jgi:hypothetical protein